MRPARSAPDTVAIRWDPPEQPIAEDEPTAEGEPAGLASPGDPHPAGSLEAALLATARADPDRIALVDAAGARTYADLAEAAGTVAQWLEGHPAWRSGDRVGLVLDPGAPYVAAFFGALLAGAVVVPIVPGLPAGRIRELLDWTGCRLVFVRGTEGSALRLGTDRGIPTGDPETRNPEALAAILFTSGSTGPPKGVMLSRSNLFANADAIRRSRLALEPSDRALLVLPPHHAFGNSVVQSHLLAGSRIVFGASGLGVLAAVARHGITALYEIPDRCVLLERALRGRRAPDRLRLLAVAGGRLAPALALALADAIDPAELYVMYGQTEATARLTCLDPDRIRDAPASIGRPIPGVEVEVVDGLGRPVEIGRSGWIRARGPGTCLGYWRDPAATGEILREGWLWTRDRGRLGSDGLLYHEGREDDVVKIGGRRVDLGQLVRDVEAVAGAGDVAAVPFETADGATRVALFLVGAEATRKPAEAWCREHLARDERPALIETLEGLPRSPAGKPDVDALAELARRRWSGKAGDPTGGAA